MTTIRQGKEGFSKRTFDALKNQLSTKDKYKDIDLSFSNETIIVRNCPEEIYLEIQAALTTSGVKSQLID